MRASVQASKQTQVVELRQDTSGASMTGRTTYTRSVHGSQTCPGRIHSSIRHVPILRREKLRETKKKNVVDVIVRLFQSIALMLLLTESTLYFLNRTSSYNATSTKKCAAHGLVDSWISNTSSKSKPPASRADGDEETSETEWPMEIIDDMMEPTADSIMDCGTDALHASPVTIAAKPEKVVRQRSVVKQAKRTRTTSLVSHRI
jgi:hypothetical protein